MHGFSALLATRFAQIASKIRFRNQETKKTQITLQYYLVNYVLYWLNFFLCFTTIRLTVLNFRLCKLICGNVGILALLIFEFFDVFGLPGVFGLPDVFGLPFVETIRLGFKELTLLGFFEITRLGFFEISRLGLAVRELKFH